MPDRAARPIGQSPLTVLEDALIAEFVRARGYDPDRLAEVPAGEREALLAQASIYASGKLTEVESRSHLAHDIHEGPTVVKTGLD